MSNSWGILGGGMLGLTLAHRLAQAGERVTLCEAAPQLGGLASAWQLGDVVWDRHYHVTLLSDFHLRGLLDELGLEREMKWVKTRTGFFTDGNLHSMSNTLEFLTFPPLSPVQKLRLGLTIFYASKISNWKRLERISVSDWLQRWSGRGVFDRIWRPLLRAKLGENDNKVSAAFIWAHIARMYRARRSGLKEELFGYVPGGYARILERLAEVLVDEGVNVRTQARVQQVRSQEQGKVAVALDGADREEFDRVVITAPSAIVSRICPELTEEERQQFDGIQYQGIVCASLLSRRPLADYYVTNITDDWVPMTAVIEMSAIVDPQELGGHHLIYLPKYVPSDDAMFELADEQIRDLFLGALERMYPHFSRQDVVAFRVSRVRNVVALPTLNYSERLPPQATSIPNVYVVNSAHILKGNLNVNETIQVAEEALKNLLLRRNGQSPDDRHMSKADGKKARQLVTRP